MPLRIARERQCQTHRSGLMLLLFFVLFQEKLDSAFPAITFNLRMLVRRFPELAEKVFDACITKKEKEVMEFDFQFLDDTFVFEKQVNEKTEEVTFKYGRSSDQKQEKSLRYSSTDTSVRFSITSRTKI